MANTLTYLIPDAIAAIAQVSRELVGFVPAVTRNSSTQPVAKGQTLRVPVASVQTFGSITPAATPPAFSDQTDSYRDITMTNLYGSRFYYTREEERGLTSSGAYQSLFGQKIAQAFRVATNALDTAIAGLYYRSSRAFGTAGTTPFASDLSALAACATMLDVNGAPQGDRHCIIDNKAAYNLLKLTQVTNKNQSGSDTLNTAKFPDLFGFSIDRSANVVAHTAGTSTGQDCTAIEPVGETSIAYDGGDSGTVLIGDLIGITGATDDPAAGVSKYVLNATVAHDETSGTMTINAPGLLSATAINDEIIKYASYRANLCFTRDALILATRPPEGGDSAIDEQIITDPITGLSFRLAEYRGYHGNQFELSILYGVAYGDSAHMVTLVG